MYRIGRTYFGENDQSVRMGEWEAVAVAGWWSRWRWDVPTMGDDSCGRDVPRDGRRGSREKRVLIGAIDDRRRCELLARENWMRWRFFHSKSCF